MARRTPARARKSAIAPPRSARTEQSEGEVSCGSGAPHLLLGPTRAFDIMSVITAILPAPRHPGRFEVLVEGKPVATLSLQAIEELQLAVGRSVGGLEE